MNTSKAATITICSSANFYKQAVEIQKELEIKGYMVIIPATARKMKETGDFNVDNYKTWYGDAKDYHKKTALMEGHFKEVEKADAILVLNFEKNGKPNYIGGNVLMEMAIAFYLKKKIYIYNEIPEESAFLEEILGMNPVVLHGSIDQL